MDAWSSEGPARLLGHRVPPFLGYPLPPELEECIFDGVDEVKLRAVRVARHIVYDAPLPVRDEDVRSRWLRDGLPPPVHRQARAARYGTSIPLSCEYSRTPRLICCILLALSPTPVFSLTLSAIA